MAVAQLPRPFVSEPAPTRWGQVFPLTDMPPAIADAIERLRSLAELRRDWDSYGSPPVTPEAMQRAFDILTSIAPFRVPNVQIDAISGGGLQFEWQRDARTLELEVLPDGVLEYTASEGPRTSDGAIVDRAALPHLLRWLMS